MARKIKTIGAQIHGMRQRWPKFEVHYQDADTVVWLGDLVGVQRPYLISITYGTPRDPATDPMFRRFPEVRVIYPPLEPQWDAVEEAPLPHVYWDESDIRNSALCLFDPMTAEWDHSRLISATTIPWAADWLACYEIWLTIGRWVGGGRHVETALEQNP